MELDSFEKSPNPPWKDHFADRDRARGFESIFKIDSKSNKTNSLSVLARRNDGAEASGFKFFVVGKLSRGETSGESLNFKILGASRTVFVEQKSSEASSLFCRSCRSLVTVKRGAARGLANQQNVTADRCADGLRSKRKI